MTAISSVNITNNASGGEEVPTAEMLISDGVDVPIPVPRESEFGSRNRRKLQDPRLPSKKEANDHSLAVHTPYRSWCTFCVMGEGKSAPHQQQLRDDGLPQLTLDYCFISTKGNPLATILVAKANISKTIIATVVPFKGGRWNSR